MSAESLFPSTPTHWRVTTLGELAASSGGSIQTGPFGSQLHAKDYVDDGIPSIMPKNISIDSVLTDDIARVSTADIERLSKYKVQTGDIVYSRRGDVEKCARITPREDGWLCGTGCLLVRILPTDVTTEYLHAYLCHPKVREWIVRHAVGATMPNLNTSILSALPVVVPSRPEMEAISSMWLTISKKIQLNHQIRQTLEQVAQAIFKSWFVDFEPVKAKMAALEAGGSTSDAELAAMQAISGKGAALLAQMAKAQPEQYAELQTTATLFPTAMQPSELGEIPEGWEVRNIDSISEKVAMGPFGSNIKRESFVDDGVPIINGQQLGGLLLEDGRNNFLTPTHADQLKKSNVFSGDIVITHRGTLGQVSIIPEKSKYQRYVVSQSQCFIRVNRDVIPPMFLALFLSSAKGQHSLMSFKSQVGVPAISRPVTNIRKIELVVPTVKLSEAFQLTVSAIQDGLMAKTNETATLAQLRDTLLPKLLSGELALPETEQQLEEAIHD